MKMDDDFSVDRTKEDSTTETHLYDKDGNKCCASDKYFMKEIVTGKTKRYFLLFNQSELVDPLGSNVFVRNYDGLTLKKVSHKAARYYLKYLQQKNSRYFIMCRRTLND